MPEFDRPNQLGQCVCPICKTPGADICQGKRLPYLVCENCQTLTQTRSRKGAAALLALREVKHPVADPDPAPAPAPKPAPPARRTVSAAELLTGAR